MKIKVNMTPPKVINFTLTDFNDNEVNEIVDKKFRKMIIRAINKFKEDTNKHLNEFKENISK
jgi:hypothetical protein